eukprot:COSAG02_NODE_10837_length_1848_cov_1.768439_2_plen_182_part_00
MRSARSCFSRYVFADPNIFLPVLFPYSLRLFVALLTDSHVDGLCARAEIACPPMISLPGLFVDESESEPGASASSDTPGVRRTTIASPSGSEAGHENSESVSGCNAGKMRRASLMKSLHILHRLAWTRQQADCTQLLKASPELAAADLTSRTDAVTVHYSRTRWNHVASTVPPLSYKVRSR